MAIQGGDILWRITADGAQLAKELRAGSVNVAAFTQSIVNVARIAKAVFDGLGRVFVAPFKASIEAAMEFGTAMAEVNTLGVKNLGELSSAVKDVSEAFGLDLVDSAKAAYQAISAGATEAETPRLLAEAAQAATAGVSSLTTAIELGMSVTNAFGREVKQVSQAYDEAFVAVKFGVTTFDALAGSVGNLSPAFVSAGLSSGEMFAAIAALTKGGIETSVAVTDLKAVIAAFQRQGDTAALQTLGFKGALELLRQETAGNDQEMLKYLGSTEAMTAVLALTGSQAQDFQAILGEMGDSTGAAKEAFDKLTESDPAFVWRQLKTEMQLIKVELGEALLPAFRELGKVFLPIVDGIREWIVANKAFITEAVMTSSVVHGLIGTLAWLKENWDIVVTALTTGAQAAWAAIKTFGSIVETVFIGAGMIVSGFVSGVSSSFSSLIADTDIKSMTWNQKLQFFLESAREIFTQINAWLQDTAIPWLKENWGVIVADVSDFYENVAVPLANFASLVIRTVDKVAPYLGWLAGVLSDIARYAIYIYGIPGGNMLPFTQNVPGMSKGGVALKNKTYTVGERGGEVFFPQDHSMPIGIGMSGRTKWRAPEMGHILNNEGASDLLSAMPVGPENMYNTFNKKYWMPGIINALIRNKVPATFAEDVWSKHTYVAGLLRMAEARATGGPVTMHSPYLVGENGPELFVPESNGGIIPNGALSGSITVQIHANTVNMRNADDAEALSRELAGRIQMKLAASGWA
jgi:TP901 family phage tail tape measure protein